ncbi:MULTISPECIES: VIT family protein [Moraxella]|uniref:Nodulin 21-related protein n=1 Tax=Moraxella catarrhalis TaxID=480 RepID=A0A7Z0UYU2_MORCA|nr:VIT family protein [Moraxella catarrhalis]OAV01127.1 nodulin 21-related protein [Moraxella catarrhalis]STY81604.1 VIT family [Moraxella catarrhalis]
MYSVHHEPHFSNRNNWLRATVLGANDGLISTASLLMGVAAAGTQSQTLIMAGMASLIAGAISMAAGEYVSVSSQSDTEQADLLKEQHELTHNPERELMELTEIYKRRGLDAKLAKEVAIALTEHNALEAHARDEIRLNDDTAANPLQAAIASGLSFIAGAVLPVLCVYLASHEVLIGALWATTLIGLAALGYLSARLGGAKPLPAAIRIIIWGVIALAATQLIGQLFDVTMA